MDNNSFIEFAIDEMKKIKTNKRRRYNFYKYSKNKESLSVLHRSL